MRHTSLLVIWLLLGTGVADAQNSIDFDGDGALDTVDNCVYAANPSQDATCTCGDVSGSGDVDLVDVAILARALDGFAPGVDNLNTCSVVDGSRDCDTADLLRLRAVRAQIPGVALENVCLDSVGALELPMVMSVIGDSITRGFSADCECNVGFLCTLDCAFGGLEQTEHSWFDGTDSNPFSFYDRYIHFDLQILPNHSAARSGARMRGGDDSFATQAARVLAQNPLPDFVSVLLGGNDLCSRDCTNPANCSSPLYSDSEWREAIALGLDPLMDGLPAGATVYFGSVPRVHDLFDAGKAKENSDIDCEDVWSVFGICEIVTHSGSLSGEFQADRLIAVGARQQRYNEILIEESEAYNTNANGKNPRGIRVATDYVDEFTPSVGTYQFGPDDINGADCFHPSRQGQAEIAERMWTRSPVR